MAPCTDFTSPQFDAAAALADPSVKPPRPDVRPRDFLGQCKPLLPDAAGGGVLKRTGPNDKQRLDRERGRARARFQAGGDEGRERFADQLAAAAGDGPVSLLRRAFAEKRRVRVVTRHGTGVRGAIEGTVAAFDKRFNMVLRACHEKYSVLVRHPPLPDGNGKARRVLERRERRLRQVLLHGGSVVAVSFAEDFAPSLGGVS